MPATAPSDLDWQRGFVDSGGERIYWELTSTGPGDDRPVVVLSHGAGGSHAVWFQQVPVLGGHARVVTWDSRGFGNSTNLTDSPSPEAAAADLTAVLDHLAIDQAHLVGQSMGGWHTAAFAIDQPDRVLSLTFADTVGGMWTDELREEFAAFQKQQGLVRGGTEKLGEHPAVWPGITQRDWAHAFLYQTLGTFHDPPMAKLGDTLAWTIEHDQIAALSVPTLFIAGTHDEIFPADALARSAEMLPGTRFVEIPDSGHSPYFEQPDRWNEAVMEFLFG